jgi:hypothetical protein
MYNKYMAYNPANKTITKRIKAIASPEVIVKDEKKK